MRVWQTTETLVPKLVHAPSWPLVLEEGAVWPCHRTQRRQRTLPHRTASSLEAGTVSPSSVSHCDRRVSRRVDLIASFSQSQDCLPRNVIPVTVPGQPGPWSASPDIRQKSTNSCALFTPKADEAQEAWRPLTGLSLTCWLTLLTQGGR